MASLKRFCVGLAVVAAVSWSVTTLGTSKCENGTENSPSNSAQVSDADGDTPALATRYHQRNRTKNFFKRSTHGTKKNCKKVAQFDATDEMLATRYHQRNRSKNFFKRVGTPVKCKPVKIIEKTEPAKEEVATRYHLRKRTSNFFKRGTC